MPETIEDLGKKVKTKYPGTYDDLADADLGRKIKAKYPGAYDDFQEVTAAPAGHAPIIEPESHLGITMDAATLWEELKKRTGAVLNTVLNTEPQATIPNVGLLPGAVASNTSAWNAIRSRLLPSATRAGAKFEQVMGAAKDVPLDLAGADEAIARAQELSERGSTMPKVMSDYLKNRATGEPMTYQVGRDFASNASGLSAQEVTATNAKMQRQVAQFSGALKSANREAAESVGMGQLYDEAMKEYAKAMTFAEKAEVIKKWAVRGAIAAAAGGSAATIYNRFRPGRLFEQLFGP